MIIVKAKKLLICIILDSIFVIGKYQQDIKFNGIFQEIWIKASFMVKQITFILSKTATLTIQLGTVRV